MSTDTMHSDAAFLGPFRDLVPPEQGSQRLVIVEPKEHGAEVTGLLRSTAHGPEATDQVRHPGSTVFLELSCSNAAGCCEC